MIPPRRLLLPSLTFALLLFAPSASPGDDAAAKPAPPVKKDTLSLADRLEAVLSRPEYRHARWGLLAVDATTGKPVFERNADQLFAPASVTKLYSVRRRPGRPWGRTTASRRRSIAAGRWPTAGSTATSSWSAPAT